MSIGNGGCIKKLRDKIHKQKGQKTKRQATIGESTKKNRSTEKRKRSTERNKQNAGEMQRDKVGEKKV